MSFDADLRDHLRADATILALVGERISGVKRHDGGTLPAITYARVAAMPANRVSGGSSLTIIRLQMDVWATTHDGARTLADAIRARMDIPATTFRGWLMSETDEYEDDTSIHRVLMEFSLHYSVDA
jgi:hypothetical protein